MKYVAPLNGDEENKERPYINANPIHGEEGSILSAEAVEHPMREIVNTIKGAGLIPNEEDLNQLQQAILMYLQPVEKLRLAKVGNPFCGDEIINDQSIIPADGRLVLLANYPELKTKLDNYNLKSIAYDETGLIRADRLGIYMYSEDRTGVYVPELGGSFVRAWTDGQSLDAERELGSVQEDAMQVIKGNGGYFLISFGKSTTTESLKPFICAQTYACEILEKGSNRNMTSHISFDSSTVAKTHPTETRPQNIALHTTLYLGKYVALQEAI